MKTVKVRCVHCHKQIILQLPEHEKGKRYPNMLLQIQRKLPEGWTVTSGEYRCKECS